MGKRVLSHLEPETIWHIFEDITSVPHPSNKEELLRQWAKSWAKEHDLPVKEDETGNLLIAGRAATGCGGYPTLVLQAHMDMVCQKRSDVEFDFEREPLKIKVDGDYVVAEGTTLGADNGIGIALALAALKERELKNGPLEALLTVNEETGFTGAFGIKPGFFTGKYLLNLDSEILGEVTIGSAGGGDTKYTLPGSRMAQKGFRGIQITVDGLTSGHSGIHIHLPRLNAIKVAVSGVQQLPNFLIGCFESGTAVNVISAHARVEVLVPEKEIEDALNILQAWKTKTLTEAQEKEPGIKIIVSKSSETHAYTEKQSKALITLLAEVPHGPLSFSRDIEELVQTSNNLAMVHSSDELITVSLNSRSSITKELDELRAELKAIGERYGTTVSQDEGYPGWVANPESEFVTLVKSSYEEALEKEVVLSAVHAGLECGLFVNLDPDIQIASIGPDISSAHTPSEKVHIKSVGKIWDTLKKIIENMRALR